MLLFVSLEWCGVSRASGWPLSATSRGCLCKRPLSRFLVGLSLYSAVLDALLSSSRLNPLQAFCLPLDVLAILFFRRPLSSSVLSRLVAPFPTFSPTTQKPMRPATSRPPSVNFARVQLMHGSDLTYATRLQQKRDPQPACLSRLRLSGQICLSLV